MKKIPKVFEKSDNYCLENSEAHRADQTDSKMLRLRPYKACDAKTIISWIKDEISFRKWCADRFESYPITEDDLNAHYSAVDYEDNFYEMTAFDETGVAGHMIMRFTDEEKKVLRFGFAIVDDAKCGKRVREI